MAEKKSAVDVLRDKYGLNLAGYNYILPGAEILRYIGLNVVYVHYMKKEGTEDWTTEIKSAKILSASKFDPMTMTYVVKYKLEDEEEEREMKMIPEGYSWSDKNPDEAGEMERFVPLSIHSQMGEDSAFFERLAGLYETRKTLSIQELETVARSKESSVTLRYSHNIGALVKLNAGGHLWIRLHKLNLIHRNGDKYALKFSNNDRSWAFMIDANQEEYEFEGGLGTFKVIDLADC